MATPLPQEARLALKEILGLDVETYDDIKGFDGAYKDTVDVIIECYFPTPVAPSEPPAETLMEVPVEAEAPMVPRYSMAELAAMGFYDVLGVGPGASARAITVSFNKLALIYHPDKGGDAKTFRYIQFIKTILLDPTKRRDYDAYGKKPFVEDSTFFLNLPSPLGITRPCSGGIDKKHSPGYRVRGRRGGHRRAPRGASATHCEVLHREASAASWHTDHRGRWHASLCAPRVGHGALRAARSRGCLPRVLPGT